MSFPDLPFGEFPSFRTSGLTVRGVLDQSRAALEAAESAVQEVAFSVDAVRQLAAIRQCVIEGRRSTFVLQKLDSRVDDFAAWYTPLREAMKADPLMRYFHILRTEIEHEGLPTVMAEVHDSRTGQVIGDVSAGPDEFGIWVAGAARPGFESGERDTSTVCLRNIRLPDPPAEHLGLPLSDFRFVPLTGLWLAYLRTQALDQAVEIFGNAAS